MELFTTTTILVLSIVTLVGLVIVFYTGLKLKNQNSPNLMKSNILEEEESTQVSKDSERRGSEDILNQFDELELTQRIYQLLVLDRIYLQQGLTVGEFAKKLGVQARLVTQIFDQLYGHTFKELTNMYRVEYAKERIEEGFLDQYTLEALGNESGFSSRTTFFNVFKKEIGVCPSDYWKNYLAVVELN